MAASQKVRSFPSTSWENRDPEEERNKITIFEVFHGKATEKIVLQRLIVVARIPHDVPDRIELAAHYEKLNFQLSKQYIWDQMTGLLLIYPSCLLCIIESSRDVLISVLKDMQQHPACTLFEAPKVVFLAHNPQRRLFQQWSYKVINGDQGTRSTGAKRLEEVEESTETLVCCVLSALRKLGEHLKTYKQALTGSVLDKTPELVISPYILGKLLARDDLLTPQQHLQMYTSPLNVNMDFGQAIRSKILTKI